MTITYRTAGAWGAGKGSNLTAAEIDTNFWELKAAIDNVQQDEPVGIDTSNGFTVSGSTFTVTMSDGTVFGPFNLPRSTWVWQGEWQTATAYSENDVFTNGASLYLVLRDHTSDASTFSATATDGAGRDLYETMIEFPSIDYGVVAYADLPAASSSIIGARAFVTDCNTETFRATAAAGGSYKVPVHCDGTNWKVG
jgi:hypothetical protein